MWITMRGMAPVTLRPMDLLDMTLAKGTTILLTGPNDLSTCGDHTQFADVDLHDCTLCQDTQRRIQR